MFAARNFNRHCFRTLSSLLSKSCRNAVLVKDVGRKLACINLMQPNIISEDGFPSFSLLNHPFNTGGCRGMSTSKGRSMRSRVERRMQKESGKTVREIRRAKKLKKKLMTDEERLIYNLKRAKKKVALLLQKLKKYELPELAPPVHDPELLTPEQLQAYKKIGFKNKNYVPVGVRGVFGGVVQNMHLHWKFHETVQVCCDNFPKEKIKEMATMLARLSGGIVINIHNVKTIIMFRGRNYRQPKILIPINTLTKRKALFKARFEQALESQKLNIKKIEQQLRRMGINPEDPVAMASIQRVASTFFNAIDKKEGSPYVFQGDQQPVVHLIDNLEHPEPLADSDQEDLDKFIAEIEDAADREWAAEEAAEKEELSKIRYWNKEDFGGRIRRSEMHRNEVSDGRRWKGVHEKKSADRDDDSDMSEDNGQWDSDDVGDDLGSDADDSNEAHRVHSRTRDFHRKLDGVGKVYNFKGSRRNAGAKFEEKLVEECSESENMLSDLDNAIMHESDSEEERELRESREEASHSFQSKGHKSEDMLSDLDNAMWESNSEQEEHDFRASSTEASHNFQSSSDEEKDIYVYPMIRNETGVDDLENDTNENGEVLNELKASKIPGRKLERISSFRTNAKDNSMRKMAWEDSGSEDSFNNSEVAVWESDTEEEDFRAGNEGKHSYVARDENEDFRQKQVVNHKKTSKEVDENWDSE
ncbi:hypothetical protein P3X46_026359 [Hevea brasiliensis]|uniref:CRM domain-containing protein n=1 Tax=Hevea brasiliensis TaxID=3981 RepID=A0ABQ9KZI4_HEVBR|nr:CRM-domain containing factor CFM9, mitochondrial [Hevea brasiliensis]KAJ9152845.1 hypothetical protein P3X46_026359 [Hevea brasiliensis]